MFKWIFNWLTKGPLDRLFKTVDNYFDNETERERIKAGVVEEFIQAETKHAVERRKAFGNWSVVLAVLFLPGPIIWWNLVFIDSFWDYLFGVDTTVKALPANFYPWMTTILGAIFFVPVSVGIVRKFLK